MEGIEAIEEFSFCGEITSRVSQVCILVMTENKVTASILLANAFEAVSYKACL